MIRANGGFGIGIDNNCAIEFIDGRYRVISSFKSANAYRVFRKNGEVLVKKILKKKTLSDLGELYSRSSS
jgi:hypothetical protein